METLAILRALLRAWAFRSHPIYKAELRHLTLWPSLINVIQGFVQRVWKPVAALLVASLALAAADFLCGSLNHPLAAAIFQAAMLVLGFILVTAILLLLYLWPVGIAAAASSVLVQERERQTFDPVLTTALDWRDVVLVKLAAGLSRFNPYLEVFFWAQAFLLALLVVLLVSLASAQSKVPSIIVLILIGTAIVEFIVARMQDYVMASMIGLLCSLLAPTRQAALMLSVLGGLTMVLVRALLTAAFVAAMPGLELPGILILLATGPSSAIMLVWQGLGAVALLGAMVILREVFIVGSLRWLLRHLGTSPAIA